MNSFKTDDNCKNLGEPCNFDSAQGHDCCPGQGNCQNGICSNCPDGCDIKYCDNKGNFILYNQDCQDDECCRCASSYTGPNGYGIGKCAPGCSLDNDSGECVLENNKINPEIKTKSLPAPITCKQLLNKSYNELKKIKSNISPLVYSNNCEKQLLKINKEIDNSSLNLGKEKLNVAEIIGIVLGSIAIIFLFSLLFIHIFRKKKK